jgi:hypothetical protein
MADTKITALAAITTVDPAADVLPIVDISDTSMAASGTTKKITSNQILNSGGTATLASATITGDLTVDTSTFKVNSSANRVGILTASPESELDVRGLIAVRGTPTFPTTGVGPEIFWSPGNSNSNLYSYNRGTSAWAPMAYGASSHTFQLSGSDAMTLNSTGLGVGVSAAASSKIHTLGNGNNVYAVFQNGDTLAANKTSQLWLSNGPSFLGANNREYRIVNSGTSATASDLVFDYWNGTAISERMRINSAGNVGVGVAPTYRITIGGDGSSAACTLAFIDTSNSNKEFRIDQSVSELRFIESGNSTPFRIKDSNVVVSEAAIATTATKGFLYIPTCAGTPTGTPATFTGRSPIVVDSTNNKLYFYSGGSWVAAN